MLGLHGGWSYPNRVQCLLKTLQLEGDSRGAGKAVHGRGAGVLECRQVLVVRRTRFSQGLHALHLQLGHCTQTNTKDPDTITTLAPLHTFCNTRWLNWVELIYAVLLRSKLYTCSHSDALCFYRSRWIVYYAVYYVYYYTVYYAYYALILYRQEWICCFVYSALTFVVI